MKKEKWGFLDEKQKLIMPYFYDVVDPFNNCVAVVTKNNRCGLINNSGKLLVDFLYDQVRPIAPLSNGLYIVAKEEKSGLIDLSGTLIVACEIDNITMDLNGVLKFEKNNKLAYYNPNTRSYIWRENGY